MKDGQNMNWIFRYSLERIARSIWDWRSPV